MASPKLGIPPPKLGIARPESRSAYPRLRDAYPKLRRARPRLRIGSPGLRMGYPKPMLIRGQLVVREPPGTWHGRISANLTLALGSFVKQRGLGAVRPAD